MKLITRIALIYSGFLILMLLGIYFASYIDTSYHEDAHQQIFKMYGINSTIKISWNNNGATYTKNGCNGNADCTNLQALAEIEGYGREAWMFTAWMIFLLFVTWKMIDRMLLLSNRDNKMLQLERD